MKRASDVCAPMAVMLILSGALGCAAGPSSPTSGSGGNGGESSTSSATGPGSASTGGTSTGATGTGGGVDLPPPVPTCRAKCTVAADCNNGNGTLYDADNWDCVAGACEETGCNTDQECVEYFKNPQEICTTQPGSSINRCAAKCAVAADCVTFGGTVYDADNWACNAGLCRYQGCNTDQECKDLTQRPDYVCKKGQLNGEGCVRTCSVAADCSIAGYPFFSEDNWTCEAGLCNPLGCNSTQECDEFYKKPSHVCK